MKSPIIKLILVFIAGIIVSRVFWHLGFFPNSFKFIINPGNCLGYKTMTIGMYICSALVAFKMLLGPLIFMVLIFVFRKVIFKLFNQLRPKIPEDFRFLLNPLVATLIFTILWSGSHYTTSGTIGIIGQKSFPAIIGVFTFFTTEYYTQIQKKLTSFFKKRDKFPKVTRYLFAFLIPIVLSLIITLQHRVSSVAVKEQFIVLVSLICGYLVLLPKKGAIIKNK